MEPSAAVDSISGVLDKPTKPLSLPPSTLIEKHTKRSTPFHFHFIKLNVQHPLLLGLGDVLIIMSRIDKTIDHFSVFWKCDGKVHWNMTLYRVPFLP